MILSSIDNKAMAKIGNEAALQYVEANQEETEVLRWMLGINCDAEHLGMTEAVFSTRLMRIWGCMSTYDLGKWCRAWIAGGCDEPAHQVLDALTSETGEGPKPSFSGSETEVI